MILDAIGASDLAKEYRRSAFEVFKLAAAIAREAGDLDDYVDAVTLALLIEPSETGEIQKWVKSMIDQIADAQHKERATWFYDRWLQRKRGESVEGDIPSEMGQVVKNMANALGIDATDPRLMELLEREIKDANPSRVLQTCIHIFTSLGAQPRWIINLGLRHAGPKTIHCTLHNWHVTGPDLDNAYSEFKTKYCDRCSDKEPRPRDWVYSPEWQMQENLHRTEFMARFLTGLTGP